MKIHCKYDELIEVKALKPYPKNRNQHTKEQIQRLSELLEYQGIRAPIVVARMVGEENYKAPTIVKGHGTLEAIKLNGWDKAPIVYQDFENEEQLYAYVQSDNAIQSWADLDFKGINEDIGDLGPDFNLDMLGIEDFELEPADKYESDEDAIPEVKESMCKEGEIWLLDEHRLMCGDSTKTDDVHRLMNNFKADLIFTDPPYNVAYEGNNWSSGKLKTGKPDWEGGIKNDKMSKEEFENFLAMAYANMNEVLNPGGSIYICYPSGRDGWSFIKAWEAHDWHFQSTLVWLKSHLLISRWDYHPIYEPLLYGWKEGQAHNFYGERNQSCLLEHKSAIRQNEAGLHPTQKPISLIEQIIKNSSKQEQILFEPFGGSGSTLIASQKTNRKCFTMELDPFYCSIIIKRWQDFTGKIAIKT